MRFDDLNLIPDLLAAVSDMGYDDPTPIQRETIPPVLAGRDVLGCAQTGTGKTAAFALPILQRLHQERKQHAGRRTIRALILTPTRELALQIFENFESYGKNLPLRSCVIFGGVGQQPQVEALARGVDILVATPGRLNDLIGQGHITLDHIEIFVLDEADRMLDMGFIHDVRKVIALLPRKRQTLLFSATMPAEVEKLALSILTDPASVKVDPVSSTVDRIEQRLYLVDKANKKLLLAKLLRETEVESALVFTRTKHGADRVVRELSRAGIPARAIHGDKSQNARQQALSDFKSGKSRVLVATDIAARGIDIAGLSPRVQLRPAQRAGGLCAPYRPHGPRGSGRQGREFLLHRRDERASADRKAAGPQAGARGKRVAHAGVHRDRQAAPPAPAPAAGAAEPRAPAARKAACAGGCASGGARGGAQGVPRGGRARAGDNP